MRTIEHRRQRRHFARGIAAALLAAPLLDLLACAQALAAPQDTESIDLRSELTALSIALSQGAIDPWAWQQSAAKLCADLIAVDLLEELRIENLVQRLDAEASPPRSLVIHAGDDDRPLPRPPGIRHRLFSFAKAEAIVPHGHNNLVSLFIVLRGRFHARHYDRLADTPTHIVIRPTLDLELIHGGQTSISDTHDNVHWFTALEDKGLLYNLSITVQRPFEPRQLRPGRVYLDPDGKELADGSILAPRISRRSLREKYESVHDPYSLYQR
ncbi:MAG TPA: hypothetical protein ENJ18_11240 [Nannocystis exedens]|nr:hypothetical protein [Nannocystis exedens]